MTQLLLDLESPLVPTFDNFVVGRNGEALAALRRMSTSPTGDASARCLYLWGESGSGRSHLLRAVCESVGGAILRGSDATPEALRIASGAAGGGATSGDAASDGSHRVLAIDDVESTDAESQEALFHAINAVRDDPHGLIVVTGDAPPRDLSLDPHRDDLRSRLAWGLVYQLHRLDDAEKDAALLHRADVRGFPLTAEVRRYLLTHFSRDLGSLMRMVDALDRHALEHQRVVTVPLIRDFLQRQLAFPSSDRRLDRVA